MQAAKIFSRPGHGAHAADMSGSIRFGARLRSTLVARSADVARVPAGFAAAALCLLLAVGCASVEEAKPIFPPPEAQLAGPVSPIPAPAETAPTVSPTPEPAVPIPSGGGAESGKVPVGVLLPLSGPQAAFGKALQEASQLAFFNIGEGAIQLIFEDTRGTPQGAQAAAQKVLARGARLIIGPLFRGSVLAVAPIARQAGVNIISFSTSRDVAGNGVYTLGFLPAPQVERIVEYAVSKGFRRFGALAPRNGLGQLVVQELQRSAGLNGAVVSTVSFYEENTPDFNELIRNFARFDARSAALKQQREVLQQATDEASKQALRALETQRTAGDLSFDALLIADGGERLLTIAPLLPFYDVDGSVVKFLGTGLWDDPATFREPSLKGGWYAAPDPVGRQAFEDEFEATFGYRPVRIASLAYDATALASVLAAARPENPFSTEILTNPSGFVGVDGIFRFLPNGLVDRGLAVIEVDRAPKIADPAPSTFQTLTN